MELDIPCGKSGLYKFFGDGEKSPTNWKKEEILGSGAFGFVYRATKETTEGEMILAVKQIRIVNVAQQQKVEDAITKETTALKQLSHERIIKYYGDCSTKLICHIFIEYMPGGSLNEFIDKKGIIEKDKSRLYSKQILEGIAYLHSVGLFHRDIKSHNVLMLDEDNVKLADFGLTRKFEEITQSCTTNVGTIRFMAPEMLKSNKYNKFVDIWSVGCVVLHMTTGKLPFYDLKEQQHVVFKLTQDKSPIEDISDPLTECVKQFLQKTFQVDPQKRPTAESLLMNNFITDCNPDLFDDVDEGFGDSFDDDNKGFEDYIPDLFDDVDEGFGDSNSFDDDDKGFEDIALFKTMTLDLQCGKSDLNEFYGDGEKGPTNWKKEEILGSGAFGVVYRVTKKTAEGEMVFAVKQIKILQQKAKDAIIKETTALKQLSHERIIKYYGVFSTELICHIFIEYMPGGSLNEFIDKKGIIEIDKSRFLSKQILEGIAYLHSVGLFHRDIKSHNVLMLDEDNVKLADFGLTREFEEITQSCTTNVGTIRFMAPEMLKTNKYNKFVDIWSVGCVVLHMTTGKLPFYDLKEQQHVVFKLIQDKSPIEDISDPLTECVKQFLQKTFQVDPQKRLTAESLLMDNFITDCDPDLFDDVDEGFGDSNSFDNDDKGFEDPSKLNDE